MSVRLLPLLLVIVSAVSHAAGQAVRVDHDRAADFVSYKTFAWKEAQDASSAAGDAEIRSHIVNAIKFHLTKGGLFETDASPDLYFAYYTSATGEVIVDPKWAGYSWGPSWSWDPHWLKTHGAGFGGEPGAAMTYLKGSLVVDVWDAKTLSLVFRGVAEDAVIPERRWGRPASSSLPDMETIDTSSGRVAERFLDFAQGQVVQAERESRKAAIDDAFRRWSLGAGVSFMATTGYYGNNAAIISTAMLDPDGTPSSDDPCFFQGSPGYYPEVDPFCDPRPDDLLAREGRADDAFGFTLTAGYDISRYFQIAFDASWFKSEVGPIDVYATETYPFIFAGQVLTLLDREFSEPVTAGEVTQVPLTLTGVVRWRPGAAFRPYAGAGFGLIVSSFNEGDEVSEISNRLETLRIRGYADEKGRNVTPIINRSDLEFDQGLLRFNDDIDIEIDRDAYEWHLTAGFEYVIDERYSVVFDGRYRSTNQEVSITIIGEDQVDIFTWPDELYHPDGSLAVFSPTGGPPNPICAVARNGYGCHGAPPFKRVTPNDGTNTMGEDVPFTCPGSADFDTNGQKDFCYRAGLKSQVNNRDIMGMWVIQGGDIEMTGYSFTVGLRVHL